jgi:3-oxoacyl-[acyl-carrier protein] reductase
MTEGADRVVGEIVQAGGKAAAVQGNVSIAADVKRIFAEAGKVYGKLDILVNNAAVYQFAELGDITEEQFHRHFNINVLGPLLSRSSLPGIGKQIGERKSVLQF